MESVQWVTWTTDHTLLCFNFQLSLKGSKFGSGRWDDLQSTMIHILNSLFKRLFLCYSLQMGLITLLCFHLGLSFGRLEGWLRALGCPAECRLGSPGFWTWSVRRNNNFSAILLLVILQDLVGSNNFLVVLTWPDCYHNFSSDYYKQFPPHFFLVKWTDWSDHYFNFPNILVWFKYETCEEGVSGLVLIQNRGVRWGIWCRMMLFQRADCNET